MHLCKVTQKDWHGQSTQMEFDVGIVRIQITKIINMHI